MALYGFICASYNETYDFGLCFFNVAGIFAHFFSIVCLNKVFLAFSMCGSILTTLHCYECVNIQGGVSVTPISRVNLPEECHRDHLPSIGVYGKAVLYQFQITYVIIQNTTNLVFYPFESFSF